MSWRPAWLHDEFRSNLEYVARLPPNQNTPPQKKRKERKEKTAAFEMCGVVEAWVVQLMWGIGGLADS